MRLRTSEFTADPQYPFGSDRLGRRRHAGALSRMLQTVEGHAAESPEAPWGAGAPPGGWSRSSVSQPSIESFYVAAARCGPGPCEGCLRADHASEGESGNGPPSPPRRPPDADRPRDPSAARSLVVDYFPAAAGRGLAERPLDSAQRLVPPQAGGPPGRRRRTRRRDTAHIPALSRLLLPRGEG